MAFISFCDSLVVVSHVALSSSVMTDHSWKLGDFGSDGAGVNDSDDADADEDDADADEDDADADEYDADADEYDADVDEDDADADEYDADADEDDADEDDEEDDDDVARTRVRKEARVD